ncbi:LacI family DNA-binding transcriptional regulator [Promicromonospora thailandica]|uniref:Transcriptional regulator, LacI family n=1 Tax=Promicromonospora thailandica TaxID=765201 RepID=A0A9X2G2H4_9MICO|nr:LacI family DNA-binding transcriptional regulator [Promicromonospora thailandica]MCP2264087.1 transcriptional regulator, LacI family [Promicromonospora thailandica]BFF21255.1 substrate-binding domain-containing protein [Promicromonospora thailandica]
MTSSRATLIQVAERAGVSLASTSRALHGTGASPAMVERVRAAAAELGYSPDATGRSLRMKRTFQVAFAVADIGNPVYVEMLTAIHEVLAPHGYRVVVMSTGHTVASTADLVRSLSSGFVDGLIVSPLRTDDELVTAIMQAPVPVVVIGRSLEQHGIDSVSTDSAAGLGQAVAHLLEIGRRQIGFVNGPLDTTPGAARQRGFDAATSGPAFTGEHAETERADDFTVAAGLEAGRRLLARGGLDAVVAANDLLAIGVIRAAGELGLSVPGDLAVTGMDDTEIGKVFQPSLTSVSLGSAERGRLAARLVLDRVGDGVEPARQVAVGPHLVVRESTAAAPSKEKRAR